jgi:hypothetical protein
MEKHELQELYFNGLIEALKTQNFGCLIWNFGRTSSSPVFFGYQSPPPLVDHSFVNPFNFVVINWIQHITPILILVFRNV